MAEQLKNILSFSLAAGASAVLPHGLKTSLDTPVVPDIVFVPSEELAVTADDTAVTLTNNSGGPIAGNLLVEWWHTIERAFGDVAITKLTPQPYIVVSPEGGNQPPWPAFPTAGVPVRTVIYARTTGSDAAGNGSLAAPYRTFARAVLDVPGFIDPGTQYVIDITDLGVEVLPQDWSSPPWRSNNYGYFVPDQSFLFSGAVTVRAYPKLALAPADAQITAADAGVVADQAAGLCSIKISAPRWIAGALKGKQIVKSSGSQPAACCIYNNTADTLFLCNTSGAVNGGAGPLVLSPGETIDIVEPSATLEAPPGSIGVPMLFPCDSISFQGIKFQCTVPDSFNGSVAVTSATNPSCELCVINGLDGSAGTSFQWTLFSTTITDYVNVVNSVLMGRRSYWKLDQQWLSLAGCITSQYRQMFFDGTPPFTSAPIGAFSPIPQTQLAFLNCAWDSCPAGAIALSSPTRLDMTACDISNTTGDAISMDGPCKAVLSEITGSANSGYGVVTDDGAHVQVDATVTIGTADGRAYTNGNKAPVAAWPGAPFNNTDLTPGDETLSRVWSP